VKLSFLLIVIFCSLYSSLGFSKEKTFHHFTFWATTVEERSLLANYLHLDLITDKYAYSTINDYDYQQVKKNLPFLIASHQTFSIMEEEIIYPTEMEFPAGDEDYHTFDEVVETLKGYAKKYPEFVQYFSLGTTVEGREIPTVRISTVKESPTAGVLFMGSHHAREHLSTEVPMLLVKHLIDNYNQDPEITKLINTRDIVIAPLINPDGAIYDIEGRQYHVWRKNMYKIHNRTLGVDLNRNYSFSWGGEGSSSEPASDIYHGESAFSEPESTAIKNFIENNPHIKVILSFHTFSELILYPWGHQYTGVGGDDQAVFEKMATTMAQWNGYTPKQSSGLYITSGGTCDWAYGEHGIFCFTFELTPRYSWGPFGFYPGPKVIEPTFRANIKPSLYLIDKSLDPYSVLE